ncbi:MAG: MFS transporter, partial [Actinobacteria bacterium]
LALLLIVGGAVYGFTNPALNKALAERVDPGRRALVFGLKHGAIPASTLLAGLAVPLLIVTIGWRPTYAVAALLTPAVWLLTRRHPRPVPEVEGAGTSGRGMKPLNRRMLTGLALAGTLATGGAVSLGTFLVAAAVDRSFSESAAGLLLFAGSAASIAARIAVGAASDARRGSGFAGVVTLMGCGAVVFFLMPAAGGAVFALLVLAAFATGWGWPGLLTFTVVNANAGTAAVSSAVTQSGVFFGAGVAPVVLGWVIDRRSFGASWILVACLLLAAAAVVAGVGLRAARTRVAA